MDQDAASTTEMTQPQPPPPQDPPPPPPPRSAPRSAMVRSVSDRKLSGVSSALAGLLGTSVTTARVIFVIGAFFGGIGLIAYSLLWLFVPDEAGRVLIRGGARDGTEAAMVAITAAIAAAIAASWTFNDTGPLVPLLVGVGIYLLSRNNAFTAPGGPQPPGMVPPPPGMVPPPPGTVPPQTGTTQPEGDTPSNSGSSHGSGPDTAIARTAPYGQSIAEYGPPPTGPPPDEPPLYAAAPTPPPASPRPPRAPAFLGPLTIGIAALVAGSMAMLHATGAIETQPSTVLAVVLGVVGIGLLISTWVGRARGLIVAGLLLIPVVAVSTAVDRIDLRGGFGERMIEPTSVEAIRDTYRLGAGDLLLDLTELDVGRLESVPDIQVDQGIGRLRVFVPDDWTVTADVELQLGEIIVSEDGDIVGTYDDEIGLERRIELDGIEGSPSVDLNLEMFAGVMEVNREPT